MEEKLLDLLNHLRDQRLLRDSDIGARYPGDAQVLAEALVTRDAAVRLPPAGADPGGIMLTVDAEGLRGSLSGRTPDPGG